MQVSTHLRAIALPRRLGASARERSGALGRSRTTSAARGGDLKSAALAHALATHRLVASRIIRAAEIETTVLWLALKSNDSIIKAHGAGALVSSLIGMTAEEWEEGWTNDSVFSKAGRGGSSMYALLREAVPPTVPMQLLRDKFKKVQWVAFSKQEPKLLPQHTPRGSFDRMLGLSVAPSPRKPASSEEDRAALSELGGERLFPPAVRTSEFTRDPKHRPGKRPRQELEGLGTVTVALDVSKGETYDKLAQFAALQVVKQNGGADGIASLAAGGNKEVTVAIVSHHTGESGSVKRRAAATLSTIAAELFPQHDDPVAAAAAALAMRAGSAALAAEVRNMPTLLGAMEGMLNDAGLTAAQMRKIRSHHIAVFGYSPYAPETDLDAGARRRMIAMEVTCRGEDCVSWESNRRARLSPRRPTTRWSCDADSQRSTRAPRRCSPSS